MRVMAIAGWSKTGKTTLVERLVPALARAGLSVSTVKHSHHALDLDSPGTDSARHRAAGAREVLVAGPARWALMHEHRDGDREPGLDALLARLAPVDLVLVEGFRHAPLAKLEVWQRTDGTPPLAPDDPHVAGIVGDRPPGADGLPVFAADAIAEIAEFVRRRARPWPGAGPDPDG